MDYCGIDLRRQVPAAGALPSGMQIGDVLDNALEALWIKKEIARIKTKTKNRAAKKDSTSTTPATPAAPATPLAAAVTPTVLATPPARTSATPLAPTSAPVRASSTPPLLPDMSDAMGDAAVGAGDDPAAAAAADELPKPRPRLWMPIEWLACMLNGAPSSTPVLDWCATRTEGPPGAVPASDDTPLLAATDATLSRRGREQLHTKQAQVAKAKARETERSKRKEAGGEVHSTSDEDDGPATLAKVIKTGVATFQDVQTSRATQLTALLQGEFQKQALFREKQLESSVPEAAARASFMTERALGMRIARLERYLQLCPNDMPAREELQQCLRGAPVDTGALLPSLDALMGGTPWESSTGSA